MVTERKSNRAVKAALIAGLSLGVVGGVGYAWDLHTKPFYTKKAFLGDEGDSVRANLTYQLSFAKKEVSGNLALGPSTSEIVLRKGLFDDGWCYTANHHFSEKEYGSLNDSPVASYLIVMLKNKLAELMVNKAVDYSNNTFGLEIKLSGPCQE